MRASTWLGSARKSSSSSPFGDFSVRESHSLRICRDCYHKRAIFPCLVDHNYLCLCQTS